MPNHYSPRPPEAYPPFNWCNGDVAKWNLLWLSIPQLDEFHNESTLLPTIDTNYAGGVLASLHPDVVPLYPQLRAYLEGPQHTFLKRFLAGPWQDLPAYNEYGLSWIDTIRARVDRCERPALVEAGVRAGKVVRMADFRRGR